MTDQPTQLERNLNVASNMIYFAREKHDAGDTLGVVEWVRSLRSQADYLAEAFVAKARADGESWEKIGAALRMTRQAAHEKYRHLDERQ